MTLSDAVQKTLVLSHKVLWLDVNRKYGQIMIVNDTQLQMRPEDLARVPLVVIIKGLLVRRDNRMLLHVHLHVYRLYSVLGVNILCH